MKQAIVTLRKGHHALMDRRYASQTPPFQDSLNALGTVMKDVTIALILLWVTLKCGVESSLTLTECEKLKAEINEHRRSWNCYLYLTKQTEKPKQWSRVRCNSFIQIKRTSELTISIEIFRNICRCFLVSPTRKSQFESCSNLNATAKWCCSSTDSSLYIIANSESENSFEKNL